MPESTEIHSAGMNYYLSRYCTAAIAAGVGLLALSQTAHANVAIKHVFLSLGNGNDGSPPVQIDFNNDGVVDVSFNAFGVDYGYGTAASSVRANPQTPKLGGGVVIMGVGSGGPYVAAQRRGMQVGPSAHFSSKSVTIERTFESTSNFFSKCPNRHLFGNWPGSNPDRFVGVKFLIHGTTHYGWVRLSLDTTSQNNCAISAAVTAYAFETVANKKISIGSSNPSDETRPRKSAAASEIPSLGMLALGAEGMPLWRREETLSSAKW
jgi:hypothetical protein